MGPAVLTAVRTGRRAQPLGGALPAPPDRFVVEVYADAATHIAREEVAAVAARESPAAMVEGAVIGTVVGEALFDALRRLAQGSASAHRFAPVTGPAPAGERTGPCAPPAPGGEAAEPAGRDD